MTKDKRVPEIRFGEIKSKYEENGGTANLENPYSWKPYNLSDVVDVRSGKDYKHLKKGDIPVYGTGGFMLSVDKALSLNEDAIGIGRKGTIDKPYILKAPFWTVDTLFFCIPREDFDLGFLYDIYQRINWKSKDESTGVPSLSKTTINKIVVKTPEVNEQRAIGAFFQQLDNAIYLHQHKYEKTVNIKKAMLKKMFPTEGISIPEIRFAEYSKLYEENGGDRDRNNPYDWEHRKLNELGGITTGKAFSSSNFNNKGEYLVITNKDISDSSRSKNVTTDRIDISEDEIVKKYNLRGNNILVTMDGVNLGKTAMYSNDKALLAQRVGRIQSNQLKFVYQLTSSENFLNAMRTLSVGNAIKHISLSQISDYTSLVPVSENEQLILGEFFQQLDELITLYQLELTKLKNIKKSLLEKMFVQEEANQ